jgi:hypothetical protein
MQKVLDLHEIPVREPCGAVGCGLAWIDQAGPVRAAAGRAPDNASQTEETAAAITSLELAPMPFTPPLLYDSPDRKARDA